ncbi:MAG: glycosyltransferase family 2 protein [Anaerolineales bacterium]|nr:glycosyltransferase family 2 protein [Anaerolineales bacterium]
MIKSQTPRITFGIILLNGRPFIRYNLRALYPFAHQIIVVEGAAPGAVENATPDGHSLDGSLAELFRFKAEEDPEGKLEIVTRDGFWSEKDEMSQAYAQRAAGDYLWQVDIDEFYQPQDMQTILAKLHADPAITAVYFKQISFWGGFDYVTDGWYLQQPQDAGPGIIPRVFKWQPDYLYADHRPVTILDGNGRDICQIHPLNGRELALEGIFMYHYSLLFPKQVAEKSAYYAQAEWAKRAGSERWAQEVFGELKRPYRVHNVYQYPSWLERFSGQHPPQIEAMRQDIQDGKIQIELRPTTDIEHLLNQPVYKIGRAGLKLISPFASFAAKVRRRWRQ